MNPSAERIAMAETKPTNKQHPVTGLRSIHLPINARTLILSCVLAASAVLTGFAIGQGAGMTAALAAKQAVAVEVPKAKAQSGAKLDLRLQPEQGTYELHDVNP